MAKFSKKILPPILDYSYPSIPLEGDNNNNFHFNYSLSIVNKPSDIDHIQIRFHSQNTNSNALNSKLFKERIYFLDAKETLPKKLKMVINNINIFDIGGGAKASRYKMQMRLVGVNDKPYQKSWGQTPPDGWLQSIAGSTSEWSNTAIIKTIIKPDFGLFDLNEEGINKKDAAMEVFSGWYRNSTEGEYLKSYNLELYKNGELLEKSEDFYIGQYEYTNINYRFRELFESKYQYKVVLNTISTTDYISKKEYLIEFDLPFSKAYDIFTVVENDKGAYNRIDINAKQIILEASHESSNLWLEDRNMDQYGENGKTHYRINKGVVKTPKEFSIPFNDFTILFAAEGLNNKISRTYKDLKEKNKIFSVSSEDGTKYTVGVLKEFSKMYIVLVEKLTNGRENYYKEEVEEIKKDMEFMIMIQKYKSDTVFEAVNWHTTDFIEEE